VRLKLLGGLALVAIVALFATRGTGRAVAPAPMAPAHRPASPPAALSAALPPVEIDSVRDPFRYADAPAAPAPSARPARVAPPPPAPTPTPEPPYRFVGVVTREGRLCAALSIGGDVVLLAPGESAGGITVLAVHEDGVRLRGPDGRDEVVAQP
jgi:hypothetical protein